MTEQNCGAGVLRWSDDADLDDEATKAAYWKEGTSMKFSSGFRIWDDLDTHKG